MQLSADQARRRPDCCVELERSGRPVLIPISNMIYFMLLSDFAIPIKGKLDDVDFDVLGSLVLNVSVC